MLENKFQSDLIKDLGILFDGCLILKNDANYKQGIPDLIIIYSDRYAFLEVKRTKDAHHQPNQDYYVNKINQMGGYANFVYPENKQQILNDLLEYFRKGEKTNGYVEQTY